MTSLCTHQAFLQTPTRMVSNESGILYNCKFLTISKYTHIHTIFVCDHLIITNKSIVSFLHNIKLLRYSKEKSREEKKTSISIKFLHGFFMFLAIRNMLLIWGDEPEDPLAIKASLLHSDFFQFDQFS